MTDRRHHRESPADEQPTEALPRQGPSNPAQSRPAPAAGAPVPENETQILRRPAHPPPGTSNVPGAQRPQAPPPAPPPTGTPGGGWPEPPRSHRSSLPPYSEPAAAYGYDEVPGANTAVDRSPPSSPGLPEPPADPAPPAAPPLSADGQPGEDPHGGLRRTPRKVTVTRVAALRSKELTHRGLQRFHGAVSADGADRSGLGHLTYAVMANYAVDAALAVALANTLFFAAATAESTGKVLLYLLLTVAPFAVIAPLIGPALDKIQQGRRFALAASGVGRAALAITMAVQFNSWVIYPCALGMLVLSKSFGVLKAALTPRVLPAAITLVKTNSRLSVFGLIAGGVAGAIAAGIAALTNSAGALWFTAGCALVGAWLCLRIPAWVESTEGEVPVHHTGSLRRSRREAKRNAPLAPPGRSGKPAKQRRVLPRSVVTTLWANSTIRVETGFLALFVAFVIKVRYDSTPTNPTAGIDVGASSDEQGWMQLLLLGGVGAAAGVGGFLGNALGARLPLRAPQTVALSCLGSVIVAVIIAVIFPGLITAGVVALVGSTASSLAKVCLDASIQQDLAEVSRASAFGRSESILQLSWVLGGVIGLLIGGIWALGGNLVYEVGFGIVGAVLLVGLAQTSAVFLGRTMLPQRKTQQASRPAAVDRTRT